MRYVHNIMGANYTALIMSDYDIMWIPVCWEGAFGCVAMLYTKVNKLA